MGDGEPIVPFAHWFFAGVWGVIKGGLNLVKVLETVMDALDVETFLVCKDEEDGKSLALLLMKNLGFDDVDLVFIEHIGPGARVRARAYLHRSGDKYGWLFKHEEV